MSDFIGDISGYLASNQASAVSNMPSVKKKDGGYGLDMQDFLSLMVAELQNQSIDSTADTSEMLNQMVMMQMVSALTNMTDASVMSYSASLVGKTVTVGVMDGNHNLQEIVGTVTGTGTMNGQQVVFINNDKYYYLNEIMAVGTLPPKNPQPEGPEAENGKPADPTPEVTPGVPNPDAVPEKDQPVIPESEQPTPPAL